ncbi:PAS domain-containing sensor histidine kinase [Bdellovibrio sp. ZAP7]|uniref:PAS domain-containing sensor histidine kinase n=1 Tax=Bdellovibrio sp. ZAP7 TaxID=2231053 RepID=UPI001159CD20|nr:PAS domain-containing protein [Bdellovibrio sp. ZAP7]QDK45310.1 PAS domain-containing sensor histidine kinase [Bdellovibrio sp. ZAP7]
MAEEILKNQKNLVEQVFEFLPSAVYLFDLQTGTMAWFNENVASRFGWTQEQLRAMGQNYWPTVMHPDDLGTLEKSRDYVLNKMVDGEVLHFEYRFKDVWGQYHWIDDRISVFKRDDKGVPISVVGIAAVIDDQKAHEMQLSQTLEKLNLSLSAAKMATFEYDPVAPIGVWDKRMFELHGEQPNEDPLETFRRRVLPEDREPSYSAFMDAYNRNDPEIYIRYRVRHDDGSIHHINMYGRKQESQMGTRFYGVAWDSTREIQTEKQIAETQAKMISAAKMAALGEMSGGIAHEINNPLTVIQARSFQLTQMVEQEKLDPEKIKQAAESISKTADKIARIIKSLRSFSREGEQDPFELVSAKAMVEETLEFCKTRFYNYGVELEVSPIDEDFEIECRVIQVEQVLLNLLNNSFDAAQKSEEKWIRVDAVEYGDYIDIRVTDSGPRIPDDVAQKIMQPFFTTKELGKGTGLGLSISSGIMKNHKGSLFLDRGAANTTFVMRLPRLQ